MKKNGDELFLVKVQNLKSNESQNLLMFRRQVFASLLCSRNGIFLSNLCERVFSKFCKIFSPLFAFVVIKPENET
jgi:hypothetical protein